jgi:hypothetical protein
LSVKYFDYDSVEPVDEFVDVEELLKESQREEERRLKQFLERVEEQLDARECIHQENLGELESKLEWYLERLEEHRQRGSGTRGERERLRSRIEEFYSEIRGERRSFWKDRQELERERREFLRELEEVSEDSVVSELMEGLW